MFVFDSSDHVFFRTLNLCVVCGVLSQQKPKVVEQINRWCVGVVATPYRAYLAGEASDGPRRAPADFPAARERSQDWLVCVQTRISTPGHPRSDSA